MEIIETNVPSCNVLNGEEAINLIADDRIKIIVKGIEILNIKCPNNKQWQGSISLYLSETIN